MTSIEMVSDGTSDAADRLHTIRVSTEYRGRYQSVSMIRDLPDVYIDEPQKLGGQNAGPTALETTLAALNACSAMIMYILRKEMKFDMQALRFETEGLVDSRSVEMRRTGRRYSEIEPITEHYQSIVQRVFIRTGESGERLDQFRSEVLRLCPMHALLRDAGVPVESIWAIES